MLIHRTPLPRERDYMEYDIFFSISQTPDHHGFTPSESEMFSNYYSQLEAADRLGFGVAWLAQVYSNTTEKLQTGSAALAR
jgi:hypothetical protein